MSPVCGIFFFYISEVVYSLEFTFYSLQCTLYGPKTVIVTIFKAVVVVVVIEVVVVVVVGVVVVVAQ